MVVAEPFEAPQAASVCELTDAEIADGAVILNVAVFTQEFASVTVHVHEPAVKPVTLAVPSPVGLPGVQLYEYDVVPPLTETVAAPLLPPLHAMFVCDTGETTNAVGAVILNVAVLVQEFASVTVHVHEPAVKPVTDAVPSPVGLPGVQLYEYDVVPPLTVTLAAPVFPPLHAIFVWETGLTTNAVGAVILNVAVLVQEFASVTVHVHEPAVKPVTDAVPSPVGLPGVQLYEYDVVPPLTETVAAPLFPPLHAMFV